MQTRNQVPRSRALGEGCPYDFPNFSVEMETGTGKTYVYLRAIFELNKLYGFKKFIIVVPSVAIREGVTSSIQLMRVYFKGLYDNVSFDNFVYQSKDLTRVRQFAVNNEVQIMVINIQAFQMNLNETLLAMRAYAPYHHLYAIGMCFSIANNQSERVPNPHKAFEVASKYNMVEELVKATGTCLNMALEAAANETQPANRVFSPKNWIKTKGCLSGINGAIRNYFSMLPRMPGGAKIKKKFIEATALKVEDFEYRWSAD